MRGRLLARQQLAGNWHVRRCHLEVWNVKERQLLTPFRATAIAGSVLAADGRMIWVVQFSPNGTLLAAGAGDGSVRLWDLHLRKETILTGHRQGVYAVTFSPAANCWLQAAMIARSSSGMWSLARSRRRSMGIQTVSSIWSSYETDTLSSPLVLTIRLASAGRPTGGSESVGRRQAKRPGRVDPRQNRGVITRRDHLLMGSGDRRGETILERGTTRH